MVNYYVVVVSCVSCLLSGTVKIIRLGVYCCFQYKHGHGSVTRN